MSKAASAIVKKKVRKKKTAKVPPSPDLLDNILPEDLDLETELDLDCLDYEIYKPGQHAPAERAQQDYGGDNEPMFPHELHLSLKNQIQGLEEEKEELKNKLKEAEERLAAASPLKNLGRASDLAANRIVELGKKVKELQAQIRHQNLSPKKSQQTDSIGGSGDSSTTERNEGPEGTCCGKTKAQLDDLNEKYSAANTKLCELRNQNQHLRHEHKLALKALFSEIGEKVNVPNILSGGQGWRGRAQQILSLQQKIAELTEKLTIAQNKNDSNEESASRERSRIEIESLRGDIEVLKTDSDTAKTELTESKKKLDESRARVRSLQAELAAVRAANSAMAEKAASDKKLLESLNAQLGNLSERAKGKECILNNKYEYQISLLKKDLSQEKQRNDQLQEIMKEKDNKIIVLQAKTNTINQSTCQTLNDIDNAEPRSKSARSSSVDKEVSTSNNNGSCNEAERVRLMELVGVNARRLQEERKNSSTLEEQLRAERHRCVRLETKLARLELERVGWAKGLYKKPPTAEVSYRSDCDWESLRDKTELLEEKCLAMESRIKTLQQEKDDDNRRFIQIIEEQRASYLDLQRKSNIS